MKKCPFCAEQIQDEAIKCRFCGEKLEEREQILEQVRDGERIFYVKYYAGYTWLKACSESQALELAGKNLKTTQAVLVSTDELINAHISRGWAISHRDTKSITFTRTVNEFSVLACLILLLLFIVPAIIYAIATASPKIETKTFPLL